ncbi:MAG: T9SS type A sorting domain-containing protein [Flavobacteriales bacterium]|nr:T9SS type A sorting domain-containing protein [Flavobacteriales bacterium]
MRTPLLLANAIFLLGSTASAQIFNQKADLPEPRYRAFSFAADGKLFTGCGRDDGNVMNNALWQYDPVTDQWTQKADYPTDPARGGIAMVIDGVPYARSGWNGVSTFTDWNRYDVATDSWVLMNEPTGDPGAYAGVFTLNGKGYAACGSGAVAEHNELWSYDPLADTWAQNADFPGDPRDFPFADTAGGFAFVGLGDFFLAPPFYSDMYKYDPVADSWTSIAPIPVSSTGAIAEGGCSFHASYNGKIILMNIMGINSGDAADFATVYVYDPIADTWTLFESTNPLEIRETPVIGQIGSKVYFGAGADAEGVVHQDLWEVDLAALFTGLNEAQPGMNDVRVVAAGYMIHVSMPAVVVNGAAATLQLYDMEGKNVGAYPLSSKSSIDASEMSGGAYVYTISSRDRVWRSGKVIIEQ